MLETKKSILFFSILHLLWFFLNSTILNLIFGPNFLLVRSPNFSQNLMTYSIIANGVMILFSGLIAISIYKYAKNKNKKKPLLTALIGFLLGFIYGLIYYFIYAKD